MVLAVARPVEAVVVGGELKTAHRFDDNELLQNAFACANGESIDTSKYGADEYDLCLAWTNECVNALNKK